MLSNQQALEILDFCKSQKKEMVDFLKQIVTINSYSWNKSGAEKCINILDAKLASLGFTTSSIHHTDVGDTLIARNKASSQTTNEKQILLCGHVDTVFPEELGFLGFENDGTKICGPGVIDMKGGLVAAIWAVEALQHIDAASTLPITVVINADEEIGSPFSTATIQAEAARSLFAYVFECSGLDGQVVTSRKGKLGYSIHCTGNARHAGSSVQTKASAILELAQKVIDLEALNDPANSISANIGLIQGGSSPNTVPHSSTAALDIRFSRIEDCANLEDQVKRITKKKYNAAVKTEIIINSRRAPMPPTEAIINLYTILSQCGKQLGCPVISENRGGVSDANTINAMGVPVLDGLGPSGDKDHTTDEFMLLESLPQRTALAAAGIASTWNTLK